MSKFVYSSEEQRGYEAYERQHCGTNRYQGGYDYMRGWEEHEAEERLARQDEEDLHRLEEEQKHRRQQRQAELQREAEEEEQQFYIWKAREPKGAVLIGKLAREEQTV